MVHALEVGLEEAEVTPEYRNRIGRDEHNQGGPEVLLVAVDQLLDGVHVVLRRLDVDVDAVGVVRSHERGQLGLQNPDVPVGDEREGNRHVQLFFGWLKVRRFREPLKVQVCTYDYQLPFQRRRFLHGQNRCRTRPIV